MEKALILVTLTAAAFGFIEADPIRISLPKNYKVSDLSVFDKEMGKLNVRDIIDPLSAVLSPLSSPLQIFEIISSLAGGYFGNLTGLSIVKHVIRWVISHIPVVIIGGVIAFGICKITGKFCQISEDYFPVPLRRFQNIQPNEYLESAENRLLDAIKKYAQSVKEQ